MPVGSGNLLGIFDLLNVILWIGVSAT